MFSAALDSLGTHVSFRSTRTAQSASCSESSSAVAKTMTRTYFSMPMKVWKAVLKLLDALLQSFATALQLCMRLAICLTLLQYHTCCSYSDCSRQIEKEFASLASKFGHIGSDIGQSSGFRHPRPAWRNRAERTDDYACGCQQTCSQSHRGKAIGAS